jgi:hypothetical protein
VDKDLFEYEMKKAGFKTPADRADAIGVSLSAYYRRVNNECDCTKDEIGKTAEIVGWEVARRIFFG